MVAIKATVIVAVLRIEHRKAFPARGDLLLVEAVVAGLFVIPEGLLIEVAAAQRAGKVVVPVGEIITPGDERIEGPQVRHRWLAGGGELRRSDDRHLGGEGRAAHDALPSTTYLELSLRNSSARLRLPL